MHPFNNFVGADMELVSGGITWRMELGYTDNVPVTLPTTAMDTTPFARLGRRGGVFPGRQATPASTCNWSPMRCKPTAASCELTEYYGANGEIETSFGQGRWTAGMRFSGGFNVQEPLPQPRNSATSAGSRIELYAATIISTATTAPWRGFHQDHSMITLGMRSQF